ncbi:MAG: PDZ domain-containing protein [Deltaproteobacteria bacterium]|nr:PDZ domain-containing protein [Deltaproteobacteria bacterium]
MRVMLKTSLFVVGLGVTSLVAAGILLGGSEADASPQVAGQRLGRGYALGDLKLMEHALFYIEETYVEPSRVDFEQMFVAALESVERRIPAVMFRRQVGGSLLHAEIGDFRTAYEVQPIRTRKELMAQLKVAAELLNDHLTAADIPSVEDGAPPFAEIEYAMINGVLSTLDPHSIFLPPKASSEMDMENEGEFGGLGITIVLREGKLTVEYPMKDTPAERAGLIPDDHISRIDGESTINMSLDEAVSHLRGPVGKPVNLEVKRAGLSEPLKVTVVRAAIELQRVESVMLDGGIGYVTIQGFHSKVGLQLHEELEKLHAQGTLRGLVLDLRGNPGGYLTQAIAVADTFLDQGVIVSTVDGNGRTLDQESAEASGTEPKYPIAVLVNANSASASEIVAGALRNHDRAVIVGERSFGKGSVQNLYPFFDTSKLKLTISEYLTPHDRSIQSVGIPADIALVPAVVDRPEDADGEPYNFALLTWRERVRREADLDHHLARHSAEEETPAWTLAYWRAYEMGRRKPELDVSQDYEVQFARDLLAASKGWTRSDVLSTAGPVVARHRDADTARIVSAFKDLDVDWTDGPAVAEPSLEMRFDVGADGVLRAGEEETATLTVTNTGSAPLYRLFAVGEFGSDSLGTREFPIGRLEPGQTRSWPLTVAVNSGNPSEQIPVEFRFRDTANRDVLEVKRQLQIQGHAIPDLTWSWAMVDEAPGGDGDGLLEVGERLRLRLTVTNRGEGPTEEVVARLKNKSGKALDIVSGTLEPGRMMLDGKPCEPTEAGIEAGRVVGDAADPAALWESLEPPVYPAACRRVMAPGESWTGDFLMEPKLAQDPGRKVELSLGDASAYDYASVMRAGFYEYFMREETVAFDVGWPGERSTLRAPPILTVTAGDEPVVDRPILTVSGLATDERGLKHVMVFDQVRGETLAGEVAQPLAGNDAMARADKVFFQGSPAGAEIKSFPFTADVSLEPGQNTITIIATDDQGFTTTRSVVTWYEAGPVVAR